MDLNFTVTKNRLSVSLLPRLIAENNLCTVTFTYMGDYGFDKKNKKLCEEKVSIASSIRDPYCTPAVLYDRETKQFILDCSAMAQIVTAGKSEHYVRNIVLMDKSLDSLMQIMRKYFTNNT